MPFLTEAKAILNLPRRVVTLANSLWLSMTSLSTLVGLKGSLGMGILFALEIFLPGNNLAKPASVFLRSFSKHLNKIYMVYHLCNKNVQVQNYDDISHISLQEIIQLKLKNKNLKMRKFT